MSETANSFTSPFESGDWGRWTNLERLKWLRAFHEDLKAREKDIAKGFVLDKQKMKRLADAVDLLMAKTKEELNITNAAVKYADAMIALGMESMLKLESEVPFSVPAFNTPKRIDHKGN